MMKTVILERILMPNWAYFKTERCSLTIHVCIQRALFSTANTFKCIS